MEDLKSALEVKLNQWIDHWKDNGFFYGGNAKSPLDMVNYVPDEIIFDFMNKHFCDDWEDNEIATDFFYDWACAIRGFAEYRMKDIYSDAQQNEDVGYEKVKNYKCLCCCWWVSY